MIDLGDFAGTGFELRDDLRSPKQYNDHDFETQQGHHRRWQRVANHIDKLKRGIAPDVYMTDDLPENCGRDPAGQGAAI